MDVNADNNSIQTKLILHSTDFDLEPPNTVSVDTCDATIDVTNINFSGDWTATIANIFKGLVSVSFMIL